MARKNPGITQWIADNPLLFAGGIGVSMGGFFVIRKVVQHQMAAEIVKEYEKDPILLGSSLYIAAFGRIPKSEVKIEEAKHAALTLAQEFYPVFGLPIFPPSKSDVIVHVQQRALAAAKKDPAGLADFALRHGGDIIQTGLDIFAQTSSG
jgi:hypothetical protein